MESAPPTLVPSTPRILLLDDDPALRMLLGRLLKREGYEVCEASSAHAAVVESGLDLALVNLSDDQDVRSAVGALRNSYPELTLIVLAEAAGSPERSEKLLILPKLSRASTIVSFVAMALEENAHTRS
jgi:CheY-like chemotaxis protein